MPKETWLEGDLRFVWDFGFIFIQMNKSRHFFAIVVS